MVCGPVDFQIGVQAGGIGYYIIMPLSDEMLKYFSAVFRLVTAFLFTCEDADVQ